MRYEYLMSRGLHDVTFEASTRRRSDAWDELWHSVDTVVSSFRQRLDVH